MFKEYNIVYQLMLSPENHTGRRNNKGEQIWGLTFGRVLLNEVNRKVVNLQTNMTSNDGMWDSHRQNYHRRFNSIQF